MALITELTPVTSLNDTDEFPLERITPSDTHSITWTDIKTELSSILDPEPVGTIKAWDKTFPSTPALSSSYVECDGSVISDAGSVYNTYRSRNLNGANVVLTLTWASGVATAAATDVTALAIGDDVTGTGIAASSYISNIVGTTVTITDTSASGSISSTFTNDGEFIRGGSASGTGQKHSTEDLFTEIGEPISAGGQKVNQITTPSWTYNVVPDSTGGAGSSSSGTRTVGAKVSVMGTSSTYPKNRTMVYIMKIK
jgi:hypothetical protein